MTLARISFVLVAVYWSQLAQAGPTNVILFIGDGMGPEAINAGRYLFNGDTAPLFFETLPRSGWLMHQNAQGFITDSAASATAMATGHKVSNGAVSVQLPGNGADLPTVLELYRDEGKRTGLVTLGTSITGATPAAFGAHTVSRANHSEISSDYLTQSRPNVLFGGSQADLLAGAAGAGYTVATTTTAFVALDPTTSTHYAALFSSGSQPSLANMTTKALDILSHDSPNGFFALIENENTDTGGHNNDISLVANGVIQLNAAVEAAHNWAASAGVLGDTLILVAADHETGGLAATNNGAGNLPGATWTTDSHSQTPVRVFAQGPNAGYVVGYLDNTDLSNIMRTDAPPPLTDTRTFQQGVSGYGAALDTYVRLDAPSTYYGDRTPLVVDLDENAMAGNQPSQSLIRFEDIFGTGDDQIPSGATVVSAALVVRTGSLDTDESSRVATIHRMLTSWDESSTWNSMSNGIALDGVEAAAEEESRVASGTRDVPIAFDVTASVQRWADGDTNFGWAVMPTGEDEWRFLSSESSIAELRPLLSVTFEVGMTGDFDGNNLVDGADFLSWQRGESPSPLSPLDLAVWQAHYGAGTPPTAAATTVPEPSTLRRVSVVRNWLVAAKRS